MPIIIDARNMGGGSIGSAAGGDTSSGTRNNVTLAAPWDESKEYLKGDLATSNGDLYQAQKSVPAGVKIANEDYWHIVVAGDKADETKKLREDVGSLDDLETESKDNLVAAINEVGNIQPDWNENDEGADGYIENRPFYTEEQRQTYDKTVDMSESKYIDASLSDFSLFEGAKYLISWDGKEYESVCQKDYGSLHIGNFALYDIAPFSKADTGEPFCVLNDGGKNWIVGEKAGASHRIVLSYGIPTVHMLSPKYIGVQSKQSYMESDKGRVKYFATPDGNYELVVPEIPDLLARFDSVSPNRLAEFRVTEEQMNAVSTSEYTEIECKSYESSYNLNNLASCYVDFWTENGYYKLLPRNGGRNEYIYFVFTTEQEQTYCLRANLGIGEFKIKRLNTDVLDSTTGIVTADKLTSPDHTTDLVNYEAFQAAVPMVQQMGITGATVGQTIKVKAVDDAGRPTQWEAANMASGSGGKMRWQKVKEITLEEQTNTVIIDKDENNVPITDYAPIAIMARYDIPADDTQTSTNGSIWIFPSATNSNASIRVISTVTAWKTTNRLHNVTAFFGNSSGIATISTSAVNGLACDNEADACMDGIKMFINNSEDHFPIQTKIIIQVLSDRG